jgi:type I restriction enzyme M protein
MAKSATLKKDPPKSTVQQLGSIVKSCRDIMRKDKGLNGDLDRLPMLTWIMFLKFLDDMEQVREAEAKLAGKRYRPSIESPYRWRDWASRPDGITGPEFIAFINQDEAVRPDGTRGAGLFAYLKSLESTNGDRRDVIARVFQGTINRMVNGYLLRDVINRINDIHFTSKDEIHTLGHLYETMLREMRDAAGDSGEFYTPRAVVKFIVAAIDPRLGETILDPAAGTGGFLVEAFEHMRGQAKKAQDYDRLQHETLNGIEAKSLPYLLCEMNLLLHGMEYPEIDPGNALRFPLREIGDKDRVDVIMTNPPFGGEEERGILSNFPEDKQTAETALLFLQLIMRKLRRPVGGKKGGRCGMVVPNGLLFAEGIGARIKEDLLKDFNLHTVVRLPNGVFAPYTDIPTNLLFFDRTRPTEEVWFFEVPLPEGRRQFTKTNPIQIGNFQSCLEWWNDRTETDSAWRVSAEEIARGGYNLDARNPRSVKTEILLTPKELVAKLLTVETEIGKHLKGIEQILERGL